MLSLGTDIFCDGFYFACLNIYLSSRGQSQHEIAFSAYTSINHKKEYNMEWSVINPLKHGFGRYSYNMEMKGVNFQLKYCN